MKKILPLFLLTPTLANAECTPTPDCASIGYTETYCETKSVKCPFDTSKLFCVPCDSSYQYTCSGENIIGGVGSSCGGKYASCECNARLGYYFNQGLCVCSDITPTNCNVGAIYYPDGKCSNDYIACLNPVGVVVKDNTLVMSWSSSYAMQWSPNYINTSLTDMSTSQAKADYNGKSNTTVIVSAHPYDTTSNNAAIYCNEYAPPSMASTKGQWYLPAAGELYSYVYGNYNTLFNIYTTHLGNSHFSIYFWSSSEENNAAAFGIYTYDGIVHNYLKDSNFWVSCFLAIN